MLLPESKRVSLNAWRYIKDRPNRVFTFYAFCWRASPLTHTLTHTHVLHTYTLHTHTTPLPTLTSHTHTSHSQIHSTDIHTLFYIQLSIALVKKFRFLTFSCFPKKILPPRIHVRGLNVFATKMEDMLIFTLLNRQ